MKRLAVWVILSFISAEFLLAGVTYTNLLICHRNILNDEIAGNIGKANNSLVEVPLQSRCIVWLMISQEMAVRLCLIIATKLSKVLSGHQVEHNRNQARFQGGG